MAPNYSIIPQLLSSGQELPKELLTPDALVQLTTYLHDESNPTAPRMAAVDAIVVLAGLFAEFHEQCIAILKASLERYHRHPIELNSRLVQHLVKLKAAQAANLIKLVLTSGDADVSVTGSWPSVQKTLGISIPPPAPAKPAPAPIQNVPRPTSTGSVFASPRPVTPAAFSSRPAAHDPLDHVMSSAESDLIIPDVEEEKPASAHPAENPQPRSGAPKLTPAEREDLKAERKRERQARKANRNRR